MQCSSKVAVATESPTFRTHAAIPFLTGLSKSLVSRIWNDCSYMTLSGTCEACNICYVCVCCAVHKGDGYDVPSARPPQHLEAAWRLHCP